MTMSLFNITVEAYEIVGHILTLGYAAMAAGLLYFILTKNDNMPKYRMSNVLSVVVMTSAFLLLYTQKQSWTDAYMFNGTEYVLKEGAALFTNGYRYLNWLIDVPMLLIQILFVAGIVGAARKSYIIRFTLAGSLMIITGYIGQYYEPGRLNESLFAWILWGLISTAFYIYVLILITKVIKAGKDNMQGSRAQGIFGAILPLFYIAWTLYPIAYVMPLFLNVASYSTVIVLQQTIYTVADISSKVIYGVMLNTSSTILSEEQGYSSVLE